LVRNKQELRIKITDILGKKTLILGESRSGKTRLAAKLAEELMARGKPEKITVIDFAPRRSDDTGGKLADYAAIVGGVSYFEPKEVCTPRLSGTSPEQVLQLAKLNRKLMEPLLSRFIKNPTEILIMNDITLYLHLGRLDRILRCARLARTFVGTAYYGSKLAEDLGTGISQRERRLTDELAVFMDQVVNIDLSRRILSGKV
jgi:hypothetical protein